MENENLEEGELETQNSSEQEEATQNNSQEDTTSGRKNKSNWKKMNEKIKSLEAKLSKYESSYDNEEDSSQEYGNGDDVESTIIFYNKNPDAVEYKSEIKKTMENHNMDRDTAWKFVKMNIPQESVTKTDFDIKQSEIISKELKDITPDEALNLPKDKKREWRKIHGFG